MGSHGIAGYPTILASPYTFKASPYSSHSQLLDLLPISPKADTRVLDVGCGPGYLCQALSDRGYRVTGLERRGWGPPEGAAGYSLVEADLDQGLPAFASKFDVIVCADVLEHVRDPWTLLRQLRGVLEPGGTLILSLPNSGHLYFRLVVLAGRFPKRDKGLFDRTHLHFFTWDGWLKLLRDSGFSVRGVFPTGVPIRLAFPKHEGNFAIRAAERLSYLFARVRKQIFAYQFVVSATAERIPE
jgi:SAM-dependent methyltransferase